MTQGPREVFYYQTRFSYTQKRLRSRMNAIKKPDRQLMHIGLPNQQKRSRPLMAVFEQYSSKLAFIHNQ